MVLLCVSISTALVAAAIGPLSTGASASTSSSGANKTYRTATPYFGFTDNFDPTGEYGFVGWALDSQLLIRTLVTTPHRADAAGARLLPDLATDTGQVSTDGLTWTFTLKPGLMFGPPVSRAITSQDIEYAFERIDTQSLVAQYGFYYDGVIAGMKSHSGPPAPISGIDTPNAQTIVFHLTRPTGDFPYRLSLPATGPIPAEVGGCFTTAGGYGRDVISSGPYMIAGSPGVNVSSCGAITPMAGFNPKSKLAFVRNPNYSAATDSHDDRDNNLDGVTITIDSNLQDIYDKISAGTLDGSINTTPPPAVEQNYLNDPTLRPLLHADQLNDDTYVSMNLLTPPFDDVHVRRAVNWLMDKATLQQAYGGPTHADVATHIFPPAVEPAMPNTYDPYKTTGHQGDLTAAQNEIKLSKYDQNQDGRCDSTVCTNVVYVGRSDAPGPTVAAVIQNLMSKIGITLSVRELDPGSFYIALGSPHNLVPMSAGAGWFADYLDPTTYVTLFSNKGINCFGQINYAEVGMTKAQAKKCGVLTQWQAASPPSVDSKIRNCSGLTGTTRATCWVKLDKTLMTSVVPWVPFRWFRFITIVTPHVTTYEFDQADGIISLCRFVMA